MVLLKTVEHLAKMLLIRGMVRAGNKHVVELDENKGQTGQDTVHYAL